MNEESIQITWKTKYRSAIYVHNIERFIVANFLFAKLLSGECNCPILPFYINLVQLGT